MDPLVTTEVVAICTMITSVVTGVLAYLGKRHAREANANAKATNDAVNNRHPDHPKLYDLALSNKDSTDELIEWRRSYNESPWADGHGVKTWLEEHKDQHDQIIERLDKECLKCRIGLGIET